MPQEQPIVTVLTGSGDAPVLLDDDDNHRMLVVSGELTE